MVINIMLYAFPIPYFTISWFILVNNFLLPTLSTNVLKYFSAPRPCLHPPDILWCIPMVFSEGYPEERDINKKDQAMLSIAQWMVFLLIRNYLQNVFQKTLLCNLCVIREASLLASQWSNTYYIDLDDCNDLAMNVTSGLA